MNFNFLNFLLPRKKQPDTHTIEDYQKETQARKKKNKKSNIRSIQKMTIN